MPPSDCSGERRIWPRISGLGFRRRRMCRRPRQWRPLASAQCHAPPGLGPCLPGPSWREACRAQPRAQIPKAPMYKDARRRASPHWLLKYDDVPLRDRTKVPSVLWLSARFRRCCSASAHVSSTLAANRPFRGRDCGCSVMTARGQSRPHPLAHGLAGLTAGTVTTAALFPLDLIKVGWSTC